MIESRMLCRLTKEVGEYGQSPDTETTEGRRCRDVTVQLVNHRLLSVTAHHHLLFLQLLSNLPTNTTTNVTGMHLGVRSQVKYTHIFGKDPTIIELSNMRRGDLLDPTILVRSALYIFF